MMQKPVYYFGLIMGVIYILAGLYFLLWGGKFTEGMPGWFTYAFGGLLVGYGVFRIFRPRLMRRN